MSTRRLTLDGKGNLPTVPDPAAIPLEATDVAVPHTALLAVDTVTGHGRRVLWMLDLQGADAFLVPDGADTSSELRVYPDQDTPRVVGRTRAALSPGALVQLHVLAAPSGPTQFAFTPSTFIPSQGGGRVRATLTYTSPDGMDTAEVVAFVDIPQSELGFGGEPTNIIMAASLGSAMPLPGPLVPDDAEWEKWLGPGVTIEAVIEFVGSPRVIECALIERPVAVYVDAAGDWPSAMYTAGGAPLAAPVSEYPLVQAALADKGWGTTALEEGLAAQGDFLGPVLWTWSAATEHLHVLDDWISYDLGTGDDEAPAFTVTGTTAEQVPSDQAAGWSTACHAGTLEQSGEPMLDLRTGLLPVWIAVYWKTSADEAVLTVGSTDWERVTLRSDSTSYGWTVEPAWLEVGANPEDDRRPTAELRTTGGGSTASLRYLAVYYRSL